MLTGKTVVSQITRTLLEEKGFFLSYQGGRALFGSKKELRVLKFLESKNQRSHHHNPELDRVIHKLRPEESHLLLIDFNFNLSEDFEGLLYKVVNSR